MRSIAVDNVDYEYDQDFYKWALRNAALLREGRFAEIDVEHIAEELEDIGKSERRALASHIRNVLLHLLKWRFQPPRRGPSWRQSIRNGRIAIHKLIEDSPSLKQRLAAMVAEEYPHARDDAVDETGMEESFFPEDCPFTLEQVLDQAFWPD